MNPRNIEPFLTPTQRTAYLTNVVFRASVDTFFQHVIPATLRGFELTAEEVKADMAARVEAASRNFTVWPLAGGES